LNPQKKGERKEKENRKKKIFGVLIVENFPNVMKTINSQTQAAQGNPSRRSMKKLH